MSQDVLEPTHSAALRTFDTLPGPKGIPIFGNAFQIQTARSRTRCSTVRSAPSASSSSVTLVATGLAVRSGSGRPGR